MMRLQQQKKRSRTWRKLLIGLLSLLTISVITARFSLANADVVGLVQSWFQRKAEIVISDLDRELQLETGIQKQRLMEEIELRMAASDQSINQFTEEQKQLYKNSLQSYADQLIANLDFSNEEDVARIQSTLETILSSARTAMDNLVTNYAPPVIDPPPSDKPEDEPPTETPAPDSPEDPAAETPAPPSTEDPAPESPAPPSTEEPTDETPPPASSEEPAGETPAPTSPADPSSDEPAPASGDEPQPDAAVPVTPNDGLPVPGTPVPEEPAQNPADTQTETNQPVKN